MKQILFLIGCFAMFSCGQTKNQQRNSSNTVEKDGISSSNIEKDPYYLWPAIDSLNSEISNTKEYFAPDQLVNLFNRTLAISSGNDLCLAFEQIRAEADYLDDYTEFDSCIALCSPAIEVIPMGESTMIGINIATFLAKCKPNTIEHRFLELAKEGFYCGSLENPCIIGTAAIPAWMTKGESSAQATVDPQKQQIYLEKWKSIQPELSGFFRDIANVTVKCLEK